MKKQNSSQESGKTEVSVAKIGLISTVAVAIITCIGTVVVSLAPYLPWNRATATVEAPRIPIVSNTNTSEAIFLPTLQIASTAVPVTSTSAPPSFTSIPLTLTQPPPTGTLVPPSATSKPEIRAYQYTVVKVGGDSGTQMSPQLEFRTSLETLGILQMEFTMSPKGCSEARLHILIDGVERYTSNFLGKSESTGLLNFSTVSAGSHLLTLQPEGRLGGCNRGWFESWGGTLVVYVSEYP
ncbi:MAG: hypothetical protein IT313_09710 [Anaerolineales bacterium]|nr:hypothetical protein [Anaerolineales bacterium]